MGEAHETVHVVDLNDTQWVKLFKASRLLRAWRAGGTLEDPRVERAPKPALSLKVGQQSSDCFDDYEVQDDSFFTTRTTTSRIATELTLAGFTESGVHASLAAGAHGLTGGASTDITWAREMTVEDYEDTEATIIHCYYKFPRAVVRLNEGALGISKECKRFLLDRRDQEPQDTDLDSFFQEFGKDKPPQPQGLSGLMGPFQGGMLARTVWLGGQLYSLKTIRSSKTRHIQDAQKKLKFDICANFMVPFVGVSVGGHQSKGQGHVVNMGPSKESPELTIYTQGGNSFLAGSSIEWAKSLGPFQSWRVIQQDSVEDVLPFLINVVTQDDSGDGKCCQKYLEALNVLWQARKGWRQQNPPPAPEERDIQTLDIKLGNRWRLLRYGDGNREWYRWTLYVQPLLPDIVARVDIHLDPTWFQSPHIILKQPPFEYTADGWGPIQINVTVVLKDGWKIKQANGMQSRQETIEYTLGWPTDVGRPPHVNRKTEVNQFEIQRDT